MSLHIQDPANPESDYLVDALLDACETAQVGGGAFAFLSAGGVQLFLRDQLFTKFITRGKFDLIVGVDAITDLSAIDALGKVQQQHSNIGARVFLPSHPRSIFHPKVAWFDQGNGGLLITGSGNLTAGGLRWNIEAFAVERLSARAMAALRAQWDAYLQLTADCQLNPQDPRVLTLLQRNAARRKAMREAGVVEPAVLGEEAPSPTEEVRPTAAAPDAALSTSVDQPADEVPPITPDTEVLVAEIPRASTRWAQANFDQATFFGFFGASHHVQRRAYLFHLRANGTLGQQEVRPAVAVQSHNYRFELDAASGLPYPANGRPIGVFAKVGARTFIYILLMPGDAGHTEIVGLLNHTVTAPVNRLRRIVYKAKDVQSAWPSAPLWGRLTV